MSCDDWLDRPVSISDLPQYSPKLLVYSFISPDEPIQVHVERVEPLLYNSAKPANADSVQLLSDAHVLLTDEYTGHSIALQPDALGLYVVPEGKQFEVLPGHGYALQVSHAELPTATARTVVPLGSFALAEVVLMGVANQQWSCNVAVDNGSSSQSTFYAFLGESYLLNPGDSVWDAKLRTYHHVDTAYRRLHWRDFEGQYITIPASQRMMLRLSLPARASVDAHDTLLVCVREVDRVYERYHTSLDQGGGQSVSAEPQRVYSNVEQGLGVFCSYVSRPRRFSMPAMGGNPA
ncbi:MAG: DUF4249 family protein [Bacteroidales bacterium]|nr:DUF4249 family protein [Bacteroidales bacterium]